MSIMDDVVLPVLIFAIVMYVCICYIRKALPLCRRFRREGVKVPARVIGFEATKLGIHNSDRFFVDVAAVPPGGSVERHYKLTTCHGGGKRYGLVTECRVCFAKDDPIPVLEEELRLWRRDIIIGCVGIAVSGLMITLFLLAAVL